MPLTDLAIRGLEPMIKAYKVFDGGGLYIEVSTTGAKFWRLKYRFGGKEKSLNLGLYPKVTLKEARLIAGRAKDDLAAGVDPGAAKQQAKKVARAPAPGNTFRAVAEAWYAARAGTVSDTTYEKERGILDRDLLPWLGDKELDAIAPPELLTCIRRIEPRAPATAARALTMCKFVWREAVFTGKATRNPALDLIGAVKAPRTRHHAAQIEPVAFAAVLKKVWGSRAELATTTALKCLAYVFCRPGELVKMRWAEVDLPGAEWRFLSTKTQVQHIVPLAPQVVALLREIHPLTGHGGFVFKAYSSRAGHLSENTLNSALRAVGIDTQTVQTSHGFRASARTLIHEELGVEAAVIEAQLAHSAHRGALGMAYDRTRHLAARKSMMQRWADYVTELLK